MIAELVSSALGLALYLNTLSAYFCYDDRYVGEITGHGLRGAGGGVGAPRWLWYCLLSG